MRADADIVAEHVVLANERTVTGLQIAPGHNSRINNCVQLNLGCDRFGPRRRSFGRKADVCGRMYVNVFAEQEANAGAIFECSHDATLRSGK